MSFRIKPDPTSTVNKTIRFPIELAEQIDELGIKNNVSFSGFVIQACAYAIANLDEDNKIQ